MDRLIDIPQLAELLGVSEDYVRQRVKRREIPFTRLPGGKLVRFTSAQVHQILTAGEQPALVGPLAEQRSPRLRPIGGGRAA